MPTFTRAVAALAFTVAAFAPAFAADLPARPMPTKAPVFSPEPVYSWTGFYVGGNVGWNWSETTTVDTGPGVFGQVFPIGDTVSLQRNGFMGGLQAGYNYQMGHFVIGVEGDFNWSAANKNNYLDLGTKNETLTPNAIDRATGTITDDPRDNKLHVHVVKIGFNYLFH